MIEWSVVATLSIGTVASLTLATFEFAVLAIISRATSAFLKQQKGSACTELTRLENSIAYAISRHHSGFMGLTLLAYTFTICISQVSGALSPSSSVQTSAWTLLVVVTIIALTGFVASGIFILQAEAYGHAKTLVNGFPMLDPGGFKDNYLVRHRSLMGIVGFILFPLAFFLHMP